MKAVRLRTEYLENPLGIDLPHPRLFWNCEGGVRQTARRILAREGDTVLWDSGKVRSDSMRAEYPLPLSSRQRVCWEVTLWDETDTPGEPAGAVFETGLLSPADFHAAWITGNYRPNPKKRYPVDCFRKCFRLESVASARLYITACGLYEARINGARVGNFVLAPGHTDYTRRIQLQTYDVTPLLRTGENQLTAELADGWYRGSCGAWGRRNQYGRETRLWAQLEVTDAAGETRIIGTDGSASNNGLNLFSEMCFAALIHKGIAADAASMPARTVLSFATGNAAKALGIRTGSIEPGYKADIVLLRTDCERFVPCADPVSALVYSCNGTETDTVIINGKTVMRKGELLTLDDYLLNRNLNAIANLQNIIAF